MSLFNKIQLSKQDVRWLIAFGVVLSIYLFFAHLLMTSFDFNDETEKFVVARLIGSGQRLYKDIFVQHGPVTYMLSHIYYVFSKSHSLVDYRIIPIVLSLVTLVSVMLSPMLTTRRARFLAGILFLFGLTGFQVEYDFVMTMYQVYAGYFFVIALSTFVIPFSLGIKTQLWQAFVAGFSLLWLFFCGIPFGIAIFLCVLLCGFGFFVHGKKSNRFILIFSALVGALVGMLVIALWLFFYGDFWGYYVDHIYFNLVVYSKFLAVGPYPYFQPFIYLLNPIALRKLGGEYYPLGALILHFLPIFTMVLFVLVLFKLKYFGSYIYRYFVYLFLIIVVLLCANPRCSGGFAESTYVLTSIGLLALLCSFVIEKNRRLSSFFHMVAHGLIMIFIFSGIYTQFTIKTPLYGVSIYEYYTHRAVLGPWSNEDMNFLRTVITLEEKVLQLPFNLNFYVWADRLPASGIFYWLPWMNEYAKHPIKGYPLDLCEQVSKSPPKIIYYTDDAIWRNPTDVWMSCLKKILKNHYFLSNKYGNIWVRDDVALNDPIILNMSIIPEDFYDNNLPLNIQKRLEARKLHYTPLMDKMSHRCILHAKQANGSLSLGSCHDKDVLYVSFSKNGSKIVTSRNECLDLQIDTKEVNGSVRLWPCFKTPYQTFTQEMQQDWFYIHNPTQNGCLVIKKNRVVQGPCTDETQWQFGSG